MNVTIEIPQDILDSARLTVPEVKAELAIHLYAQRRLSIGKARELAEMSLWQFRHLLAAHQIPVQYDVTDLEVEVATLKKLGRF
jgi:predicted HTH domain antitoxin